MKVDLLLIIHWEGIVPSDRLWNDSPVFGNFQTEPRQKTGRLLIGGGNPYLLRHIRGYPPVHRLSVML